MLVWTSLGVVVTQHLKESTQSLHRDFEGFSYNREA